MSWWKPGPGTLARRKVLQRESGALRSTGKATVGGTLYVTTNRVAFVPNKLNLCRRSVWEVARSSVIEVGDQPRTSEPFSGATRNSLQLSMGGRSDQRFVVNHLSEVLEQLHLLLPGPH